LRAIAITVLAAACTSNTDRAPKARGSSSPGQAYRVTYDPKDFSANVTNPWFPLKPGTTLVYRGAKDGKQALLKFAVTQEIEKVDGVPCRVVLDRTFLDGVLEETTKDFYSQDSKGNVWYFGEDTAELGPGGTMISTDGTWHTGDAGALPGIFMSANPRVGEYHRQEFYPGHSLDEYRVVDVSVPVSVPYGRFPNALLTAETTPIEPDVLEHKYYVNGIGNVMTRALKGGQDIIRLVAIQRF
jgi:hypothetical protein